jgi:hypothetical protein
VYVNITKQSVALFLIAEVLRISKYQLFLLYETFGNDCFLFFTMFQKADAFKELTEFRLKRCFQHSEKITPILLGAEDIVLSATEERSYKQIHPYLYEKKLRIIEDQEAFTE